MTAQSDTWYSFLSAWNCVQVTLVGLAGLASLPPIHRYLRTRLDNEWLPELQSGNRRADVSVPNSHLKVLVD